MRRAPARLAALAGCAGLAAAAVMLAACADGRRPVAEGLGKWPNDYMSNPESPHGPSTGAPFETPEQKIARLEEENAWLRQQNARLEEQNTRLVERIEELERRLGLSSRNSGKPPSSDGLKKPKAKRRTRSQRGKSERKPGGQPGHKGETLRRTDHPNRVEDHFPPACEGCGSSLPEAAMTGTPLARQVFDLPEVRPLEVTEHRAHAKCCRHCGTVTRAAFPAGVSAPVQYGSRIAGVAVYLQHAHFLPEDRLSQVMAELFGAPVTAATLAAMSDRAADRLRDSASHVQDLAAGTARVKHLDETGFRIGGQTQWLHVICTPHLAAFRVSARRGDLLSGVSGIVVHDHWKPYFTLEGMEHGLRNAHHLRELQALVDIEGEGWAGQMQQLLRRANRAARIAQGKDTAVPATLVALIERRYDRIVAEALAFHESQPPLSPPKPGKRGRRKRRIGHNLALRLRDRKCAVLRFLTDLEVPFTNNEAERDLRMMKLRQKISGGFRSAKGAENFAILRSVIATARKQGWNIIESLISPSDRLIPALKCT